MARGGHLGGAGAVRVPHRGSPVQGFRAGGGGGVGHRGGRRRNGAVAAVARRNRLRGAESWQVCGSVQSSHHPRGGVLSSGEQNTGGDGRGGAYTLRGTPAAVAGEAATGIETLYRRPDAGGHSRGAPGRVEEDVPFDKLLLSRARRDGGGQVWGGGVDARVGGQLRPAGRAAACAAGCALAAVLSGSSLCARVGGYDHSQVGFRARHSCALGRTHRHQPRAVQSRVYVSGRSGCRSISGARPAPGPAANRRPRYHQ
mmetsp:Transcript_18553/g.46158  ORF Transcript_18553/g.46158 Transcript_18553/m.46158 type:complete len:257 (+) Transcript_18553:369-1139(+)